MTRDSRLGERYDSRLNGASSGSSKPKLSVIVTGRNDDRAPDQFERLVSLQRTIAYSLRNVPFEFLFIEWNPDPGVPYLGEALFLLEARHYVVTREAHLRLVREAALTTRSGVRVKSERAFLLNHANNVGMKHARGEWILITNLDDLFPPELGRFLETGWTSAAAVGWHPRWSYRLLCVYRDAQRTRAWKLAVRASARVARPVRAFGRGLASVGSVCLEPVRAFRRWLAGDSFRMRPRGGGRLLRWLRQFGPAARAVRRRVQRVGYLLTPPFLAPLARRMEQAFVEAVRLLGAVLAFTAISIRRALGDPGPTLRMVLRAALKPVARTARWLSRSVGRPLRQQMAAARWWLRERVKQTRDFFIGPRVRWDVGRVPLKPGTLYRVRRQHLDASFARRGAMAPSVKQYMEEVRQEAGPGPWNNNYPWTWACGDFLLMDYATWKRIGGFPQQIGQLHADSVTVLRIIAQGCKIALLDWHIYHMDHDDRFDAVPYVEYDLERVHQYFGPGWTNVEDVLVERPRREGFAVGPTAPLAASGRL